ncbi:hypothetical protein T440DRAFT_472698 [Plenodomus tracheiphilus IPT5]|uniref:Uncharacterized protein n=1 Tax=Plenodomus tracheiphilus IPT5 TaxID=1408161 RepID=A0A6A7AQ08_9PLEO|nr:hypothetical protein T440DRAFT_472698 [Plenodomus tracheiphilus IPT5]
MVADMHNFHHVYINDNQDLKAAFILLMLGAVFSSASFAFTSAPLTTRTSTSGYLISSC